MPHPAVRFFVAVLAAASCLSIVAEDAGAQSVYLIDGDRYTDLADLPPLQNGDTVRIAPGYVMYGRMFILRDLQDVTIQSADASAGRWIRRNAFLVPVTIEVPGPPDRKFDVFRSKERAVASMPTSLWEDWDDPANRDQHGFRTAFVPEVDTGPDHLWHNRGWWWDPSTRTIYVSVPVGETAADRQYLVGRPGHGIVLQNCTRVTIEDGSIELTTEPGPGRGYSIQERGSSSSNTVRNCDFRAYQYHALGTVANNPDLQSIGNRFFEHVADTDSQLVFYANGGQIAGAKSINDEFHLVPWLSVDGAPHAPGDSVAIASHHAAGSAGTAPRGLEIINPTVKTYAYNAAHRRTALVMAAANTRHEQPDDALDPETYPIVVRGGHIEGTGVVIGGGSSASCAVAFVGTRFELDGSSLQATLPIGGLLGVTSSHPEDSRSTLGLFACTVSAKLSEQYPSQRALFARNNGAKLIVENSTVWIPGSGSHTQRIFGVSATTGLIHVTGSIFAAGTPGVQLMAGGDDMLRDDPQRFHWRDNLYSVDLHDTFNPSVSGVSRATFASRFDPNGLYDVRPSFVDNLSLKPDTPTRGHKAESKPDGPNGINQREYDMTYGAWQYGPNLDCAPDLAAPFGTLNFFDVTTYLALFNARDPAADLAEPTGVFNFFDLSAYLAAYNAGCP